MSGSVVERLRDQIEFVSKPSLRRALAKQYDPVLSLDDAEALLAVVEAAYIAKHEGRFEPLHNALRALEDQSATRGTAS